MIQNDTMRYGTVRDDLMQKEVREVLFSGKIASYELEKQLEITQYVSAGASISDSTLQQRWAAAAHAKRRLR